jgi:hypothetical protein
MVGILVIFFRLLRKLASDSRMLGAYGTEDQSVLDIHEDLYTAATTQLAAEVEFKGEVFCRRGWILVKARSFF